MNVSMVGVLLSGVVFIGGNVSNSSDATAKKPALEYDSISLYKGDNNTVKINNITQKSVKDITVSVKNKKIVSAVTDSTGKKTAIKITGKKRKHKSLCKN